MTTKTTHTSGPWTTRYAVVEKDAKTIARCAEGHWGHHEGRDECIANARLIAAAPDMLAALEGLFEHCEMIHKHWGEANNGREATAGIAAARAAIRKAWGG